MKPLWRGLLLGTLVTATTALADVAPPPSLSGSGPPPQELVRRHLEDLRVQAAALASAAAAASVALSGSAVPPAPVPLAIKWAEQVATRSVRRQEHRALLVRELGSKLADPAVNAELVLHARHVAELGRAEFLAKNVRSGAAQAQLLARIQNLVQREDARHRAALAKLAAASPAPSGSTPPGKPVAAPRASGAHP